MTLKKLLTLQDVNNRLHAKGVITRGSMEFLNKTYYELFLEEAGKKVSSNSGSKK